MQNIIVVITKYELLRTIIILYNSLSWYAYKNVFNLRKMMFESHLFNAVTQRIELNRIGCLSGLLCSVICAMNIKGHI